MKCQSSLATMNLLIQGLVLIPEEIRVKASRVTGLTMNTDNRKETPHHHININQLMSYASNMQIQ